MNTPKTIVGMLNMNRIILISPNVITRISCHEVETKHRWNKGVEWVDGDIKHIPQRLPSFPIALQVNSFQILTILFIFEPNDL